MFPFLHAQSGERACHVYNPVGFPSSEPTINPNYCYFFLAEGTFHTLHGASSTTHISPSPFHCVQRPLPFQIMQRWLTPPDTAAVPWHGFLRYFVNATSFRKLVKEERSKAASPVWVEGGSEGKWCCVFQGQALSDVECSALPHLLAPVAMAMVCPVKDVCITAHSPCHLQQGSEEQELFSHHGWGNSEGGATIRAGAPALVSSHPQLPAFLLSPSHTHSSKGGKNSQILIIALWVPKAESLAGLFITDMIRWWAEKIPSEVAFISADSEWTRYVS